MNNIVFSEKQTTQTENTAEEANDKDITPKGYIHLLHFVFFLSSIIYLETLYKHYIYGSFTGWSLLFINLFSILAALMLTFLTGIFKTKINYIIAIILMFFIEIMYCAQYIYSVLFKTPMLVFSISQAAQVAEFSGTAFEFIADNFLQLITLFLPFFILIFIGKKIFRRLKVIENSVLLICSILLIGTISFFISISGNSPTSAYTLFYNEDVPLLAQQEFGVFTSMSIDTARTIFGFTPKDEVVFTTIDNTDATSEVEDNLISPEIPEIEVKPNTLDIDFSKLTIEENNQEIIDLHNYFSSVQPTNKNDYTGIFEGCNLIYIVAESFSQYLLDPQICPTLYKMATEGLEFTNFYTPIWNVSTSDGEYVACTGLFPKSGCWSFSRSSQNYLPFCLGNQFNQIGYPQPLAYHNNTYTYYDRDQSHPNMGYEYKGLGNGLAVKKVWPESDVEMFEKTIPEYINEDRFHAYYMTVSGHLQYNFSGNVQARTHKDQVASLSYSEEVKAYLACNLELEYSMKYLLEQLSAAGKLENTVIVISADHYPYGLQKESIDELAGHVVDETFELYRNGLIIWKDGMEHLVIDDPTSSVDILPTVSNLFGLPYDSRLLMGRDMLSDSDPLVIFNDRSWITSLASYDSQSRNIIGNVSNEYVDVINTIVANKMYYSAQILDNDYYRVVFGDN